MTDYWTPYLDYEGTDEILKERDERPLMTEQRKKMLERVRDAILRLRKK